MFFFKRDTQISKCLHLGIKREERRGIEKFYFSVKKKKKKKKVYHFWFSFQNSAQTHSAKLMWEKIDSPTPMIDQTNRGRLFPFIAEEQGVASTSVGM